MTEEISFNEFEKVELRIATILSVEPIPNKDKLFRLEVSLGDETRVLVSGLKPFFSPQELLGKQIVVVANLAPRTIAGIESRGMLLAVQENDSTLSLLMPDKPVSNGRRIE